MDDRFQIKWIDTPAKIKREQDELKARAALEKANLQKWIKEKGKSNGLSSHSRSGRDTKATTKEETAGEETQKQYYFTQQRVKTDNSPSTEKSKRASAGKECFLFLRVMSGVRRIAGYCRRRPTPLPQERKPRRTRHTGAYMDVQKDMS